MVVTKNENGIEFKTVTDKKYHYSFGYYSNNSWLDENRIVVAKSKKLYDFKDCSLAVVDFKNGSETDLKIKANSWSSYVVCGKKIYFCYKDSFFCLDTENGAKNLLFTKKGLEFPHSTRDGRYINFDSDLKDRPCFVYDTQENTLEEVFSISFAPPFTVANHKMICPTDKDKIFFSHEGDTYYISNRLWLYEKGKDLRCIAKQRLGENGVLADCFGHESWAGDGKGLYFVKYQCSPEGKTGICYVDLEGNQTDVIFGKYHYWHVSASPCGRYLAADTNDKTSAVCLINLETGEEKCMQEVEVTWKHPSHPHPCFSGSGETMCYHALIDGQNSITAVKTKDVL